MRISNTSVVAQVVFESLDVPMGSVVNLVVNRSVFVGTVADVVRVAVDDHDVLGVALRFDVQFVEQLVSNSPVVVVVVTTEGEVETTVCQTQVVSIKGRETDGVSDSVVLVRKLFNEVVVNRDVPHVAVNGRIDATSNVNTLGERKDPCSVTRPRNGANA